MSSAAPASESYSSHLNRPEADHNDDQESELLSVSWNQDYGCFAAGTSTGFRIYNSEPFKEMFRRELKGGGFGIVEMLFRSNMLALVGGGANPEYPPNKVIIWNDQLCQCISEFTFRSDVCAVRLRTDMIVVVLERKIHIYDFNGQKQLHVIDTSANPRGLCCLSHHPTNSVLACPAMRQGQVRVEHFGLKVTRLISAHESHIACITLTLDGLLLATASMKGTLIRIFSTMDGTHLQEVRRGLDAADIYSIVLSPNVQWLAVSSDRGTIHVFNLRLRERGDDAPSQLAVDGESLIMARQNPSASPNPLLASNTGANNNSLLSFMKGVLPKYFSSEWSFAQFHLPEVTRYVTAFGAHNTVKIIGMDGRPFPKSWILSPNEPFSVSLSLSLSLSLFFGDRVFSFYKCSFDPVKGGEMLQIEYFRFLKVGVRRQMPNSTLLR